MQFSILYLTEALAIALALSLDCFACGLAYGASHIKIPVRSALVVSLVCSITLGFTLIAGSIVAPYIDAYAVKLLSFGILLVMGLLKVCENAVKLWLKGRGTRQLTFKLFDVRFILKVFEDEQAADNNKDKVLSAREAISLALALSLDGLAVGFSAGISGVNSVYLLVLSLAIGATALLVGQQTGNTATQKTKDGLCWVSGIILIALAISKLL